MNVAPSGLGEAAPCGLPVAGLPASRWQTVAGNVTKPSTPHQGTTPPAAGQGFDFTDSASVGAGWNVANGGNYGTTVSTLIGYIWTHEAENDKSRRVWPNPTRRTTTETHPCLKDSILTGNMPSRNSFS
jgi:hypothetical protein